MKIAEILEKIREKLPKIEHTITFYNNGIVFSSDFPDNVNIPSLGTSLSEIIQDMSELESIIEGNDVCEEESCFEYKRIIYETKKYTILILKIGEDSNIALFFKHQNIEKIKISMIRDQLEILEDLIDTTDEELDELGIRN